MRDLFESKGFVGLAGATFITERSSTEKPATNRPNNEIKSLELPGQFPYVVKNIAMPPMTPETNDTCVTCGICANNCPTAAIDFDDCKTIDSNKCIKCRSCVKRCPFNSKEFTHPGYKNMQNMLETNFAHIVRTPEIFIG